MWSPEIERRTLWLPEVDRKRCGSERYADQNNEDHQAFVEAIDSAHRDQPWSLNSRCTGPDERSIP